MNDSKYQLENSQYRWVDIEAAKALIATLTEAVKLVEESNHPEGYAYTSPVMVVNNDTGTMHYQKYRVSKNL